VNTTGSGPGTEQEIDRRALVTRHTVEVTGIVATSPLSVGNGDLCYTADVTGLQTFPGRYPVRSGETGPAGTLLATMASWGWHSVPGGEHHDPSATTRAYPTPRGPVEYVDMRGEVGATGESHASAAEAWLRANPHRLDLARIGLVVTAPGGVEIPGPADVTHAHQRLDLWTGAITSRYRLYGTPVRVTTVCHPHRDLLALRVESALPGLAVRLAFPYGSQDWAGAADWTRPGAHTSTLRRRENGWAVHRVLDDSAYQVAITTSPAAEPVRTGPHEFHLATGGRSLDLLVEFRPGPALAEHAPERPEAGRATTVDETLAATRAHWAAFWTGGGAVELAGSTDERAPELERRVVLSQYLTAIHCAGSTPPQETGLMVNSWRGRFHLEMHWWHGAHFPLWGRPELLARSLGWYARILPRARETARRQGYAGVRWPKQVGPDGRESPSPIGPFLIWQQPHPIYLAELMRRTGPDPDGTLRRYAAIVLESAAFMADYAADGPGGHHLGPPLVPAQESYAAHRATLTDPAFELAYWSWALGVAQEWRRLLGLDPEPSWAKVAAGLARPLVRDGRYTAIATPPYLVRDDHPSMLYALGFVPPTPLIDPDTMRATLRDVLSGWRWDTTWGWGFPAIAMTATRLRDPETALSALLMPTPKNTYLPNGHNRQTARLPIYLPGNGALLSAIALMTAGWPGASPTPGFPADGTWTVRHEGLHPLP
jgi:hypothetical protein